MVKLPSGVFKPYAGVSTAILVFTKTNSGGTDYVWFYDVEADGWSLDDKRTPLLANDKLGPVPVAELSDTNKDGATNEQITGAQISELVSQCWAFEEYARQILVAFDDNGAPRSDAARPIKPPPPTKFEEVRFPIPGRR